MSKWNQIWIEKVNRRKVFSYCPLISTFLEIVKTTGKFQNQCLISLLLTIIHPLSIYLLFSCHIFFGFLLLGFYFGDIGRILTNSIHQLVLINFHFFFLKLFVFPFIIISYHALEACTLNFLFKHDFQTPILYNLGNSYCIFFSFYFLINTFFV